MTLLYIVRALYSIAGASLETTRLFTFIQIAAQLF